MLRARWLVVLALGLGGSAAAQDMPLGRPDPIQPVEQESAPKPVAKKQRAAPKVVAAPTVPMPRSAPRADLANVGSAVPTNIPAPKLPPPKPETVKADVAKLDTEAEPKRSDTAAGTPKVENAQTPVTSTVFGDVPFDERIKIQAALFWSGDYAGVANGEDPLLTAVKNYQKRIKAKVTGLLTPEERASLVAAARNHEKEFGWSVMVDPATGIRIGLPTKMVPYARDAARGTRWSSKHGEVQVETFRIKDPNLKLAALFDQQKREPATRKVEYSVLNDDNFFISGLQGLKKFSVRAKMRDGEVRGFTMLFDQMMETIVSPVMVAMASAFSPFPERSAPFAALAKSVEYGNGIVVSTHGHIVTTRRLTEGCQVIVVPGLGDADRVVDDKDKGLALLRVYAPGKLSPLSLARDLPKTSDVTLVGIPDPKEQNNIKKLTEIKARLADGSAIELRQPVPMAGFSGAAAIDAQDRFLGLTEMRNFVLASTEPSAPPMRLVSADTVRAFLSAQKIDAASSSATDAKASVVRIICVRK